MHGESSDIHTSITGNMDVILTGTNLIESSVVKVIYMKGYGGTSEVQATFVSQINSITTQWKATINFPEGLTMLYPYATK
jgi:hypothetical protein